MALDEGISRLIGRIYAGAGDPDLWDQAIDDVLEHSNSRFIFVSVVDLKRREYSKTLIYGPDDARFHDGMRDYATDIYRMDPMLRFAARHPDAGFVALSTAIADGGIDHDDHAFVRWNRDVLGLGNSMVRYTAPEDGLALGVSLHPSAARETHSRSEVRLFRMVFEHMERAMRIAVRPPDFTSTDEARVLLDRHGRIRAVSEAARALLAKADGLAIAQDRLVAARNQDSAQIDALIRSALGAIMEGGAGGGIVIPRPSGRRGWLLMASPLPNPPSPFEAFRSSVQLRIVDPEAGPPAAASAAWAKLFGLTPAETRLAETLLGGEGNLREASDTLGIAHATARVHLRNLFDKVGVRSQLQLVRLLTRLGGWYCVLLIGLSPATDMLA